MTSNDRPEEKIIDDTKVAANNTIYFCSGLKK